MDSRIKELTEKVYNEGVQRGNAEAERILSEARQRATELEDKAKAQAAEIVRVAQREADTLRQNTESELRLYASQLVESIRASVTDKLTGDIASDNVSAASTDPEFMRRLILELVSGFDLDRGVEISTANAEALSTYFAQNAKAMLERGVRIKSVAGKPTDFSIGPADGAFKIQIGEAEFLELFKSFLRPQLAQRLF